MTERDEEPKSKLHALLQDLARDPDATMLALAARAPFRSTEDLQATVSPRAAGLRPSERELLRSHRHELAELLRVVAVELLLRDGSASRTLSEYDDYHRPMLRVSDEEVSRRGASLTRSIDAGALHAEVSTVIRAIQGDGRWTRLQPTAVALASLRLWPRDLVRNVLANAYRVRKEYGQATRVIGSMLERSTDPLTCFWAWNMRGHIQLSTSEPDKALASYRRAVDSGPFAGLAAVNLLIAGVILGDTAACRHAARFIECAFENHRDELRAWIQVIRSQRQCGKFPPSVPDLRLVDPDACSYGELSREVVRAIQ